MLRKIVLIFIAALIIHGTAMAGEYSNKKSINFAEDLFFLIETITKETGAVSRVSLDSHPAHGGLIRIIEFNYNDRILSVRIHKNVAGEDAVWLETISPTESFFEDKPIIE
ncbi:MAG: hypothetical protein ABFD12_03900 [Syntrophorhabdus sp.]